MPVLYVQDARFLKVNQCYLNWRNFQTVIVDGVHNTRHMSRFSIFPVSAVGFILKHYCILCDDPLHKHSGPAKGCWRTLFEIVPVFGQTIVVMCITSSRTYP
jgi:hypothetical protein